MSSRTSWPAALAFFVVALLTEFLPVVGGQGASARFDWSFIYITLHFVLLPIAAGLHIVWNLGALVFGKSELRSRLLSAASVVVSLSYVALLFFRPVFPLWADDLWQSYSTHAPWAE